jgi:uncharacterized protein with FMN-binding domain
MANTAAAKKVLDGSYQSAEDTHQGTLDLFDEIAQIRETITKDPVN